MQTVKELQRLLNIINDKQWKGSSDAERIKDLLDHSDYMACIIHKDLITPWYHNLQLCDALEASSRQAQDFDLLTFITQTDNSVLDNILKMRAFFDIQENKYKRFSFSICLEKMTVEGVATHLEEDLVIVVMATKEPLHAQPLTEKEKQIVFLLQNGLARKEIATQLNISLHTVHSHVKNIYRKQGVSKITQVKM